ncbi:FCD domain-containing protein [Aeromicrobium sp. UC242_57]|uniref:FCD domain-containing protein n=1 Tax=Aeromicrobium sp. UC242_57 TaxID=3374624 RepID=UPI003799AB62
MSSWHMRSTRDDARCGCPSGAIFGHIEDNANDHHAEILAAIRDKDADRASETMTAHIESTRRTIESWLKR